MSAPAPTSSAAPPPSASPSGNDDNVSRETHQRLMHTVEFDLAHGDTLVLVDLPAIPRDPRKSADCDNIAYRSHRFRVSSEKLLATGSTKFARMLSPPFQSKLQLRRKLVALPDGVRYLLDLTPPSEGDQLVYQMTELSLTPGIIAWWASHHLHAVDSALVSGHDDVCTCRRRGHADATQSSIEEAKSVPCPPTPHQLTQIKLDGRTTVVDPPPFRLIPDYCPIRHRNAIVRLLMLIQGRDVLLDSASRVWTLVALANMFDCVSVVRGRVVQWIMHGPNTRFIQVLPEEALRIGFSIRNPQITQCAFRILVNELALDEAGDRGTACTSPQTTVFGRRWGQSGDELSNMIQHAARALVERVSSTKALLQSPDLLRVWNIPEWSRLQRLERLLVSGKGPAFTPALDSLRRLMKMLPMAVASKLARAAQNPPDHQVLWSMDADRATYVLPQDFESLKCILTRLNLTQALLCPFVWSRFGELCSSPLYLEPLSAVETVDRPRFGNLVQQVEDALQALVLAEPASTWTLEWFDFLNTEKASSESARHKVKSPLVDLDSVDWQVRDALLPLTNSWVRHDIDPPLNLTRHLLLTLTIEEMKFLPLWAGGFDDGTGGVFETFVPPTDMGPSGPGPAYHTGKTVQTDASSLSGTLIDDMSAISMGEYTTAASVNVHDGLSTTHDAQRVAKSHGVSQASESLAAHAADYDEARAAVPAEHQRPRGRRVLSVGESDSGWDDELQSAVLEDGSVVLDGFEVDDDDAVRPISDLSDSEGSMVVV